MVKKFLKIAGVKTQSEFYKKYPSEEAFFKAHPEAQHLVNQKMAYGGMYAYQVGGQPTPDQFPDYASYQTALNNWAVNQNDIVQPQGANALLQFGNDNALPAQVMAKQLAAFQQAAAQQAPPMVQTASVPKTKLNDYQGGSIWDFLTTQGKAGDFSTRKKLANTLGMSGYTGTADQNKQMMQMIQQSPDILNSISGAPSGSRIAKPSKAKRVSQAQIPQEDYTDAVARQESQNPYVMASSENKNQSIYGENAPMFDFYTGKATWEDGSSLASNRGSNAGKIVGGLAGAAGAGAAGYGAYKEIQSILDGIKNGKFQPTGQMKGRLTRLKNQWIKESGVNAKNQAQWFEGLPKQQQSILKNLDAMEIPGDIHTMAPGTASRDLYTRDMLNEAGAEQTLENDKATQEALKEADAEAAALRKVNASKAAAARWGTKVAETEKAVGLGDKIAGGLKAASRAKYIAPVFDAAKGFFETFHEYGGPTHNNSTYSGGMSYGSGGTYVPNLADSAYGVLPEYMYAQGGQNGVQDLYDAGYHLEYLAQGGPTFSAVTQYPHQAYVPAFDWMADGGPTFSNVTQYPHQQYVPALDWMARGGQKSSGGKDQQIVQAVAQMLEQGAKPEQILQQLVQAKIPENKAVAIIQNVMQKMGGQGAPQQPQPSQQMSPEQQQMMAAQQQGAGMGQPPMAYGGMYAKGGEYDVNENDVQDLINKGYTIQYL